MTELEIGNKNLKDHVIVLQSGEDYVCNKTGNVRQHTTQTDFEHNSFDKIIGQIARRDRTDGQLEKLKETKAATGRIFQHVSIKSAPAYIQAEVDHQCLKDLRMDIGQERDHSAAQYVQEADRRK